MWDQWSEFDRKHLWHPYAPMRGALPALPVTGAHGLYLRLADGRELLDGIGSWWSVIHGYNHPTINAAIAAQMRKFSHVMFGGLTHQAAVELGERLLSVLPPGLDKIFYADSGSIAAEVAIKMTMQYQFARGKPGKRRMLTVKGGYHGDTLGTMALCDPDEGMHSLFSGVLTRHFFAPAPPMGFDRKITDADMLPVAELLDKHGDEIAGVMLEPVLQGAGGMRVYAPEYLRRLQKLCRQYDVLLALDEIATGFGRTGRMWAAEHAGVVPDIMCIGKALTGGHISLAATITTEEVSDVISSGSPGAFMHGPTFMANPLACAAACGAFDVLRDSDWQKRVSAIEASLKKELSPLAGGRNVAAVRVIGSLGALEAPAPWNRKRTQQLLLEHDIWARPFGKVLYVMPSYLVSDRELHRLTAAAAECADAPGLLESPSPGDGAA